jgi:RHS repeat-associated protein
MSALHMLRRSRFVACALTVALLAPMFPRSALAAPAPAGALPDAFPEAVQEGQTDLSESGSNAAVAGAAVSASVDPSTGALHASLPFELPRARGGVQPTLALKYSSSGGYGVGGSGWGLDLPSIERHNLSGPPQYGNDPFPGARIDPNKQDRFTFAGKQLVPICFIPSDLPGCLNNSGETLPSWAQRGWHYYRLEGETGALLRFFWSPDHQTWVVQKPDGATLEFGVPRDAPASIDGVDADPLGVSPVFRWNLVRQYDAQRSGGRPANAIRYAWTKLPSGEHRTKIGYLTDIFDTPKVADVAPTPDSFAHHTRLRYGEGDTDPLAEQNRPLWRSTPTKFLLGVDVTSKTFEGSGARGQVRRYHLAYASVGARGEERSAGSRRFLESVQLEGRCLEGPPSEDGNLSLPSATGVCTLLPRTEFTYTQPKQPAPHGIIPIVLANYLPSLFDFNGDGLPDLVTQGPCEACVVSRFQQYVQLNSVSELNRWDSHFPIANPLPAVEAMRPDMEPYNAGNFGGLGKIGVLWAEPNGPADPPFNDLSRKAVIYTPGPDSSFGFPGTWTSKLLPPFRWGSVSADRKSARYVQKYGNADVDGDGLSDLITGFNQALEGNFYNPPEEQIVAGNLHILFSRQQADGNVLPFGGPGPIAFNSTNGCIGGEDAGVRNVSFMFSKGNSDDPEHDAAGTRTLADLNGDGLPDWIDLDLMNKKMFVSFGHGDGTFGQCAGDAAFCACDALRKTSFPIPPGVLDSDKARFHDINGDGFADLIVPTDAGFDAYENLGGSHFATAPIGVSVLGAFAWPHAPPGMTTFLFADMNGSGVDDVVLLNNADPASDPPRRLASGDPARIGYVDFSGGQRPGLLTGISNLLTRLSTTVDYGDLPSLERDTRDREVHGIDHRWDHHSPVSFHAVTTLTIESGAALSAVAPLQRTRYLYRDPIFDGRDRRFVGFLEVATITEGDDSEPTSHVWTKYLQAHCDQASPCASAVDDPNHVLRGLPTLSVTDTTGSGTRPSYSNSTLSTVHHAYAAVRTYKGLDGRNVRRVFESATDTYLNDAAKPFFPTSSAALVDLTLDDVEQGRPTFAVEEGSVHRLIQHKVDPFGLTGSTTDFGQVDASGASLDGVIGRSTLSVPVADDSGEHWVWRATKLTVGATNAEGTAFLPNPRTSSLGYDAHGNLTEESSVLTGTQALARWRIGRAGVAPPPDQASHDGNVVLRRLRYDGAGNVVRAEQPGTGRCVDMSFDASYSQVTTLTKTYVDGCGSRYMAAQVINYDRGLERPLVEVSGDGQRTDTTYEAFGRPRTIRRPDSQLPGLVEDTASIVIDYHDTHVPRTVRTQIFDSGTPRDYWRYLDAFGHTIQTVSPADASAGDQGTAIVSGRVRFNTKGRVRASYLPRFDQGTDPENLPLTLGGPARTLRYDGFGRTVAEFDLAGVQVVSRSYHARSIEVQDAAQLDAGSAHAGARTTRTFDGHGRAVNEAVTGAGGGAAASSATTYSYLATGEVASVTRSGANNAGVVQTYFRWMKYDSLGRMVLNAEPNTARAFKANASAPAGMSAWSYAYNDAGDIVGTADARGCGKNVEYDGAGRIQLEDYSPCTEGQPRYTAPSRSNNGVGTEAYYVYDDGNANVVLTGRLADTFDRGAQTHFDYDARGRVTAISKQIANPDDDPGAGAPRSLASRYSTTAYTTSMGYDDLDRLTSQSTGAALPELQAGDAALAAQYLPGTLVASYSARGVLTRVSGSYGTLISNTITSAEGRPISTTSGDRAGTVTEYAYDNRLRLSGLKVSRPPLSADADAGAGYIPPGGDTNQTILADDVFLLDQVGNPVSIQDRRLANEWPTGQKPVTRDFAYDDQYRATSVTYSYPDPTDAVISSPSAPITAYQSPLQASTNLSTRVLSQTYAYDGLGNLASSTDDRNAFWDRSVGSIAHGSSASGPNQARSAHLPPTAGTVGGGDLTATYDDAGNLATLLIDKVGCGGTCAYRFEYEWDEVGNLTRAQRFDGASSSAVTPAVDVHYAYDAGGHRVLRSSNPASTRPGRSSSETTYDVEIFPSLTLNHTTWDVPSAKFVDSVDTEAVYLAFGGTALGRVSYDPAYPSPTGNATHVFLQLGDHLGSTSMVIDKETSELVERTTYQPFGAVEADYRPERWKSFREDYKYSGKREDVEIGIIYYGARYYSPYLGHWISPDPLTIHGLGADLNPYAFVRGRVMVAVDPNGLEDDLAEDDEEDPEEPACPQGFRCHTGTVTIYLPDSGSKGGSGSGGSVQAAGTKGGNEGLQMGPAALALAGAYAYVADQIASVSGLYDAAAASSHETAAITAGLQGDFGGAVSLGMQADADTHRAILAAGAIIVPELRAGEIGIAAEGLAPALEGIGMRGESALQGSLLRQQLAAEEIAGAQMPSGIGGYAGHGLEQAISRDGVGVSLRGIRDAVASPLSIFGKPAGPHPAGTFGFVGRDATVVLNADGKIVTTWARGSAGFRLPF